MRGAPGTWREPDGSGESDRPHSLMFFFPLLNGAGHDFPPICAALPLVGLLYIWIPSQTVTKDKSTC